MNDAGLTHLSVSVEDMSATLAKVGALRRVHPPRTPTWAVRPS